MKCKNCGSIVSDGDVFCGECGAKVEQESIDIYSDSGNHNNFSDDVPVSGNGSEPMNNDGFDDIYLPPPIISEVHREPTPDENGYGDIYVNNYGNYDGENGNVRQDFGSVNTDVGKPEKKSGSSTLTVAVIVISAVIVIIAVLTALSLNDSFSFGDIPVLSSYESFVRDIFGKEDKFDEPVTEKSIIPETAKPVEEEQTIWTPDEKYSLADYPSVTEPASATEPGNPDDIPSELSQYASGLVPENRQYMVSLTEHDWFISFRSSPKVMSNSSADTNLICRIQDGTAVDVKYIYDNTWAVFQYNGQWGFSSLYASNNPSEKRILVETGDSGGD